MKTSNKALALAWTLACTGPKLCPPFNTRSTEGTIGTLDTALNRGRRSTIHRDKRGLCAGEVTWKRTDKTPFMIPAGKRQPRRGEPRRPCSQAIIVQPRGRPSPSAYKGIWIRYRQGSLFRWALHGIVFCIKRQRRVRSSAELCAQTRTCATAELNAE